MTRGARTSRRRGSSLVEVVVTMTIASIVLTVAMTTLHLLVRVEDQTTEAFQGSAVIRRVAERFREDVRTAMAVTPIAVDVHGVRMSLNEGREVTWEFTDDRLARTVSQNEQQQHSDLFRLRSATDVRFAVDEADVVSLTILRTSGVGEPIPSVPRRELVIEAVLNRSRRHAQ